MDSNSAFDSLPMDDASDEADGENERCEVADDLSMGSGWTSSEDFGEGVTEHNPFAVPSTLPVFPVFQTWDPPLIDPAFVPDKILPSSSYWSPSDLSLSDASSQNSSNQEAVALDDPDLFKFLRSWAEAPFTAHGLTQQTRPLPERVHQQKKQTMQDVFYKDLKGGACDFQGINWEKLGTTRLKARRRRRCQFQYDSSAEHACFREPTGHAGNGQSGEFMGRGADGESQSRHRPLANSCDFFRFRKTTFKHIAYLASEEGRDMFKCPPGPAGFYPSASGIMRINLRSGRSSFFLDAREVPGLDVVITALDANHGLVVAGTYGNGYMMKRYDPWDDSTDPAHHQRGVGVEEDADLIGYVGLYLSRTSSIPQLAVSRDDGLFQIIDTATQTVRSQWNHGVVANSSAVSLDGRMRVMVGNNCDIFLTDADHGRVIKRIEGHEEYGLACHWDPQGYVFATASQDHTIKIWDCRRLTNANGAPTPLHTLWSEMSAVKSLCFSSQGSGTPLLIATEHVDYVSLIDATTFQAKQTFDIFGEVAGACLSDGDRVLNLLCSDERRGGLLQFQRCMESFWQPPE